MDASVDVFERCLYTLECPPVGLLIRTSGETRLSDFMGWQCAHATLVFLEVRILFRSHAGAFTFWRSFLEPSLFGNPD